MWGQNGQSEPWPDTVRRQPSLKLWRTSPDFKVTFISRDGSPVTLTDKMNNTQNKRLDWICKLLTLNLIVAGCFLTYDLLTLLLFLFIFSAEPESLIISIWPQIPGVLGDVISIILIKKTKIKIQQCSEYIYCIVALVISSILSSLLGALLGLIALISLSSKRARDEFNSTQQSSLLGTSERESDK